MCFSCKNGEKLRQFDIFGAPVGVTYGGESRFRTGLGGCVTILLLIFFGSNMVLSLINVAINQVYTSKTNETFTAYPYSTNEWKMSTQNQTLAGHVQLSASSLQSADPEEFFRVQFYVIEMKDGVQDDGKWVPSKRCKDIYADTLMLTDDLVAEEFSNPNWICPDLEEITILNYPSLYEQGDGLSFNMVINTCKEAVKIETEFIIKSYVTDPPSNCYGSDDSDFFTKASEMSFKGKMMTQNPSDPQGFKKT